MDNMYFGYTVTEIINICKNQNAENMIIRPENIQDLKRNHILDTITQILRWDKEIYAVLINSDDDVTDRWACEYNHTFVNIIKDKKFYLYTSNEVPKKLYFSNSKR